MILPLYNLLHAYREYVVYLSYLRESVAHNEVTCQEGNV
jgi:hypothetical protein